MDHVEAFVARWQFAGGSERANYQLFLTELCALLELPLPEPACDDTRDNAYVFERRVVIKQPDGSANNGFIDLYKRGCFVLEAKQTGKTLDSHGWDKAMLRAHNQADQYIRALPTDDGRPPFIVVVDVGRNIELYAEFSRSGATYTPYPDSRNHRIRLEDLRNPEIRERLKAVWQQPLNLDPARLSAKVTRDIANQLAKLARSLELDGNDPQHVAGFLMRALFTMFAEDVGLLPERGFTELLQRLKTKPETFAPMLEHLWQTMNSGGFSPILESTLLKFNGGLFADHSAIALNREQMALLLKAAEADWRYVEPAIFGTLLERALDAKERHKLGAHYTPRAYVERLVLPTVIEPLRGEWKEVQVAALTYDGQGKRKEAVAEIRAFHRHLCDVRVLDPACGSGNFLYVTLEHMKRLEGEVLNLLHDLGESQGLLELEGVTVDPHQFLGIEINPRAARIAEIVLWIGYLQWHFRTHGSVNPPEPVLRDFKNIENRDALIAYDAMELIADEHGKPITRWDGSSMKTSPITGELIPDESAQQPQYRYTKPRKAEWPRADYIVGNPPFIGNKRMRSALGENYVESVRATWSEVTESADFVMYWWHIAADTVRRDGSKRFGFITTNSIKQSFNRRVLSHHIEAKNPLALVYAIPDHPWVDSADGAAVRIALTVGAAGDHAGKLVNVCSEQANDRDEIDVMLQESNGKLFADLKIGANIAAAKALKANSGISNRGVIPHGEGMTVNEAQAISLGLKTAVGIETRLRPYRNGRDLMQTPRNIRVIDMYGLSDSEVRDQFPQIYQWLIERVKPTRDMQKDKDLREKWWLHRRNNEELRRSTRSLNRYIATVQTSKHCIFTFLDIAVLPDDKLIAIASDQGLSLGILSSRVHTKWTFVTGATLEDRPVYVKTTCFETYPFPDASAEQQAEIRRLAEHIDAHRKQQQAAHAELTLTGIYNVLEKLRAGEALTAKDKVIHEQGLVSVLRELHDDLDRAVFAAYGWDDLAKVLVGLPGATTPLLIKSEAQAQAEETLLMRLVELNSQRAAEEAQGLVRWLRPDYQNPSASTAPQQTEASLTELDSETVAASKPSAKSAWPKQMREQVAAVRQALSVGAQRPETIAAHFKRSPTSSVIAVLEALEELGMVEHHQGHYRLAA